MKNVRSLIVGVVVAAVIVGGVVFAFGATHSGNGSHEIQVMFDSADGLVSGSDVLASGAKIGYISDIQPSGNEALVTLEIGDAYWPLHRGVTAQIRPKSLLGEKYVELDDGPANGPVLDASTMLHASSTADPVELDQFINSLDPATRTAIRILLDDLGAGVAGRGEDLNAAIAAGKADLANLAVTGKTLDDRDPDLDKILVGLDGVLSTITTNDQLTQMSQLITNGQHELDDIESVQAPFSRSFVDADIALGELNTALDGAVPSLRDTLSILPSLVSNLGTETSVLTSLAQSVTTTRNVGPPGTCTSSTTSNVAIVGGLTQCSPLWMLVKGLVQGPTVSGGALECNGYKASCPTAPAPYNPVYTPIFRICLSNVPANPVTNGSCDNSVASQAADFESGGAYNNLASFAAMLGA